MTAHMHLTPGRRLRRGVLLGVVALLASLLTSPLAGRAPTAHAQAQGTQSQSFNCGANTTFTVPSGVTQIHAAVIGASGEAGQSGTVRHGGSGGIGALVQGTLAVTAGQQLQVIVGCPAGYGYPSLGGSRGRGRGASAGDGGTGGGASAVASSSGELLIVAGGGGGGGGGGLTGNGGDGGSAGAPPEAGKGGQANGGGDGGCPVCVGGSQGGDGTNSNVFEDGGGGGGGGGGYCGPSCQGANNGGHGHGADEGGGGGGGGGAGNSFAAASVTDTSFGTSSGGAGLVTLSWTPGGAAPSPTTPAPAQLMTISGQVHHVIPPLVSENQISRTVIPHTGATVEALVGSTVCGTAVTDASGRFQLSVAVHPTTPGCGQPGATVRFRVEGTEHPDTVPFVSGGAAAVALRSSGTPVAPPRRWP